MDIDIENIIELDRLNMTKFFKDSTIQFDPCIRRKGLLKEIEEGASFIMIERNCRLVAYIEYVPVSDGNVYVASIQIHPEYTHRFILRRMLSNVYHKLKNNFPFAIRSSAHLNNKLSLKLHDKLGFEIVDKDNERIYFTTSGQELVERLSGYSH